MRGSAGRFVAAVHNEWQEKRTFQDIFVLLSLLGSLLLLAWRTVNCFKTWRNVAPEQLEILPFVGWLPAAVCLGGVIIAGRSEPLGGNVLQLSVLGTIAP